MNNVVEFFIKVCLPFIIVVVCFYGFWFLLSLIPKKAQTKFFAIAFVLLLVCSVYFSLTEKRAPKEDHSNYKSACGYEYEWLWDDMHYPNSSAIYAYDYDECYQKMVVVFTSNEDVVYIYSDVPKDIYDGFRRSQSKGSYYNEHIKGQYECEKVE